MKTAVSPGENVLTKPLNPRLRYLRISIENRVVLLVLGDVESHLQGNTEIWYSAMGEVIRLRDGRILGTSGLSTDWRKVDYTTVPAWDSISDDPIGYRRTRDEMPGYRMGIEEYLTIRTIAPPPSSHIVGVSANGLRWFEEREQHEGSGSLPPARYAFDISTGMVIYGEQCLTANICIAWQRWPVAQNRPSRDSRGQAVNP